MKRRILFIDEDIEIRGAIQKVLEGDGYEVLICGGDADTAAPIPIDLLLVDMNLPSTEGCDLLEKLAREHAYAPILVLTAFADQYKIFIEAGAVMEKPVDPPALLKTINQLLSETKEDRLKRLSSGSEPRFVPSSNTELLRKLRERAVTPFRLRAGQMVTYR